MKGNNSYFQRKGFQTEEINAQMLLTRKNRIDNIKGTPRN